MKTNTASQLTTAQTTAQTFELCRAFGPDNFGFSQPFSFNQFERPALDLGEDELAVSFQGDFIGTIFLKDSQWHINDDLGGFESELAASQCLLALEILDGHMTI